MNPLQALGLAVFQNKHRVSKATADKLKKYLTAEAEVEIPTYTHVQGTKLREDEFDLSHNSQRLYQLTKSGEPYRIVAIFYKASKNLEWFSAVSIRDGVPNILLLEGTTFHVSRQPVEFIERLMKYNTTDIYGALKVEQAQKRLRRSLNKKPFEVPVSKPKTLKI